MFDVQYDRPIHETLYLYCKVGCAYPMVAISIVPQAEFGPNDYREDAPHFNPRVFQISEPVFIPQSAVILMVCSWIKSLYSSKC